MLRDHSHTDKRSAFTLVEMVVVLLIIAILVSLTWSVVMNVNVKVTEAQTRTEISELAVALQAFMSDYGLSDPPPSKLILNETSPLSTPSAPFLQKVFGKNLGYGQAFVDWNGDGSPNGPWILGGEQCLVFYLGGIPNTAAVAKGLPPAPQGFSTNNINPALIPPGTKTKGPYFQFVSSRLVPASGGFFYYEDPWQAKTGHMPYVYFSSNGNNNGYNYTDCNTIVFTDALGLHNPLPYWTAQSPVAPFLPTAYTNSNTFQIISAGKDGKFGYTPTPPSPFPPPVGLLFGNWWSPTSGAVGTGADDQANFSSTLLGQGQN